MELKEELDFCDDIDVICSMDCVQEQSEFLNCRFIVFEVDFYTYLSGFVGRDIK